MLHCQWIDETLGVLSATYESDIQPWARTSIVLFNFSEMKCQHEDRLIGLPSPSNSRSIRCSEGKLQWLTGKNSRGEEIWIFLYGGKEAETLISYYRSWLARVMLEDDRRDTDGRNADQASDKPVLGEGGVRAR